jgi:bifunctional non-homologous end joining protein LigD
LEPNGGAGHVLFSAAIDEAGPQVLRHACKLGLEGIVSKLRGAPCRSGRGRDWLESKCKQGQEFVIGGYKLSDKTGRAFRSLLLGFYKGDRLVYAGRVGTGFTTRDAHELLSKMEALRSDEPTIENVPRPDRRHVVWIKPKLVAEIEFTERTPDGELRHPSFKGLRLDKPAGAVRIEKPSPDSPVRRRHVDHHVERRPICSTAAWMLRLCRLSHGVANPSAGSRSPRS